MPAISADTMVLPRIGDPDPTAADRPVRSITDDPLMKHWRSAGRRGLAIAAVVTGVTGLLWVVVVVAPPWFVPDGSLEGLKAQNEVRTTLLQGLGGVALLMGAYFTYRQLHTAWEGQITERFTRAIDQLGHASWMCGSAGSMRWSG
jgi:hypothetical protein